MITKVIDLQNGDRHTLYFSESLNKWVSDYVVYRNNLTNFERLQERTLDVSNKMMSSILEFYDDTSELNQMTIKRKINKSTGNVPVIYDMILTARINRKRA